jgi:hypothetical protein
MPEQPVKGETAIKRMMKKALGQEQESSKSEEQDPLGRAQKVTEQIIANEMIENTLAKGRAERAESEAKAAKAARELEKIQSGEDKSDSPFKVKGEVNMGTIDFQAQQREAQAELKRLREDADSQLQTQGQVNQQLRDELHKKEMAIVEIGLKAEIQKSNETLERLIQQIGTKKGFMEEYNEALTTAKTLGLYNPQAGGDASVTIQLKKMEFEQTMALRKMMQEDKRADKQFQLEMRKYDDEREFKKEEVERAKKRDEMWAGAPETIGRFIARGVAESGMGGDSVGESPISEEAPPAPKGKQLGILAGVGEAGEAECPQCQQTLAIGPTARVAVCANCGAKYPIKRVKQEATTSVEEE